MARTKGSLATVLVKLEDLCKTFQPNALIPCQKRWVVQNHLTGIVLPAAETLTTGGTVEEPIAVQDIE